MAKLLGENLTLTDRVHLSNLKTHNGLTVIKKLLEDACRKATADVITLDPVKYTTTDKYLYDLAYLQQRSRIYNEISADLLASIEWHSTEGLNKEKEEANMQEKVNRLMELARTANPE